MKAAASGIGTELPNSDVCLAVAKRGKAEESP
jgi:hypothetical protein